MVAPLYHSMMRCDQYTLECETLALVTTWAACFYKQASHTAPCCCYSAAAVQPCPAAPLVPSQKKLTRGQLYAQRISMGHCDTEILQLRTTTKPLCCSSYNNHCQLWPCYRLFRNKKTPLHSDRICIFAKLNALCCTTTCSVVQWLASQLKCSRSDRDCRKSSSSGTYI